MEKRSGFFPKNYNLLRMYHGVQNITAVRNTASFQSNHSNVVDGDARRSIPRGERYTAAVVLYLADIVDVQRCRYCIVVYVGPVHTRTSTGRSVHCSMISVTCWIRQALLLLV